MRLQAAGSSRIHAEYSQYGMTVWVCMFQRPLPAMRQAAPPVDVPAYTATENGGAWQVTGVIHAAFSIFQSQRKLYEVEVKARGITCISVNPAI